MGTGSSGRGINSEVSVEASAGAGWGETVDWVSCSFDSEVSPEDSSGDTAKSNESP